jgi:hypothetical protein
MCDCVLDLGFSDSLADPVCQTLGTCVTGKHPAPGLRRFDRPISRAFSATRSEQGKPPLIFYPTVSSFPSRDLVAELPFTLMHPKPEDEEPALPSTPSGGEPHELKSNDKIMEANLIQLE